ncbi:MAG: RHS repeat-associated core domain-containing protein [Bacilli bacterium]|nr:RHS repeat-associated core domain-containing protein [Bacilli bacterium]
MQNILGIIDSNSNLVVKYEYTAYGTITAITGSKASTIGADNPFRYKGYYYDSESNMYYCKSRYYVPEWCRWLNGDVSSLNPSSINGMNLFSYCDNNPICIVSGFGMSISSSRSFDSVSIEQTLFISAGINTRREFDFKWPQVNSVAMSHYTKFLINDSILSKIIGNISYTATVQLNQANTFYSFNNIGNDGFSTGVGMSFGNWYNASIYVTSDIGFGSSWQLTPWLTGSSGWSLQDGILFSGGVIIGDTTHEITVSVGNGAILGYALCAGLTTAPFPGARIIAAGAACVIFIVDSFK